MRFSSFVFVLLGVLFLTSNVAAWYAPYTSWTKRAPVNWTITGNSTPSGYQATLNLTFDANMNADFSDVRITNSADSAPLPFNIRFRSNSNWALIHVRLDAAIASSAASYSGGYVYFKNPSATDASDPYATYDLYDNFTGSALNTSQLASITAAGSGSQNVSSGYAWTTPTNAVNTLMGYESVANRTFTNGYLVETDQVFTSVATYDYGLLGFGTVCGSPGAGIGMTNGYALYQDSPAFTYSVLRGCAPTHLNTTVNNGYLTWAQANHTIAVGYDQNGRVVSFQNRTYTVTHSSYDTTYLNTSKKIGFAIGEYTGGQGGTALGTSRIIVRRFYTPQPVASVGAVETATSSGVSISAPANATFVNASVSTSYVFSGTGSDSWALCYRLMDGSRTYDGNVTNGTTQTALYSGLSIGSHNFTVLCSGQGTGANVSAASYFTRLDWSLDSMVVPATNYELTNTTYAANLTVSSNVAVVSGGLSFNGTIDGLNTSSTVSGQFQNLSRYAVTPLLQVNNSNVTVYWSINLVWVGNGSTQIVNFSSNNSALWFAYYPANFSGPASAYEGDYVALSTGITALSSLGTASVTNYLNASSYGVASNAAGNWASSVLIPSFAGTSASFFPYGTLNVSYGASSRLANSSNSTLLAYLLVLDNCSASSNYSLNFSFFDEETLSSIYATMGATFTIRNAAGTVERDYNFSWVNQTVARICLTPYFGTAYVDSIQEFSSNNASDYSLRRYFLANASISNSSQNINLYLLDSSLATLTSFTLTDSAGVKVSGYTVVASRFYPALNSYLLVGMGKTDNEGTTGIYLKRNDASYRFFAYEGASLIASFQPQQIVTCDPGLTLCTVSLSLNTTTLETYFSKAVNLAVACAWDNATTTLTCSYSDPQGTIPSGVRLRVVRVGTYTGVNATACLVSSTAASGALACNLGDISGKTYFYSFDASYSPPVSLVADYITSAAENAFSSSTGGSWVAAGLILGISFIAAWNPALAVAGSTLAVILSWAVGALFVTWPAIVALIIAAIVLIVRMRI